MSKKKSKEELRKEFIHHQNTTLIAGLSIIIDSFENTKLSDVIDSNLTPKVSSATIFTSAKAVANLPRILQFGLVISDKEKREEFFEREDTWEMLLSKGEKLSNFLKTNGEILGDILVNQVNKGLKDEEKKKKISNLMKPVIKSVLDATFSEVPGKNIRTNIASLGKNILSKDGTDPKVIGTFEERLDKSVKILQKWHRDNENEELTDLLKDNGIRSNISDTENLKKSIANRYKKLEVKGVDSVGIFLQDINQAMDNKLNKALESYNWQLKSERILNLGKVLTYNYLVESNLIKGLEGQRNIDAISEFSGPVITRALKSNESLVVDSNKIGDPGKVVNYVLKTLAEDNKNIDNIFEIATSPLIQKVPKKEKISLVDVKDLLGKVEAITKTEAYKKNIAEKVGAAQEVGNFVANVVLPHIPFHTNKYPKKVDDFANVEAFNKDKDDFQKGYGKVTRLKLLKPFQEILGSSLRNPESIKFANKIVKNKNPREKIRNVGHLLGELKGSNEQPLVTNLTKDIAFMDYAKDLTADGLKGKMDQGLYDFLDFGSNKSLATHIKSGDKVMRKYQKLVIAGYDVYKGASDAVGSIKKMGGNVKRLFSGKKKEKAQDALSLNVEDSTFLERIKSRKELEALGVSVVEIKSSTPTPEVNTAVEKKKHRTWVNRIKESFSGKSKKAR